MHYYREESRDIPVLETDVFVVGAGTAGCIAAIAAARAGAKVILVEKMPVPGGTYTNGGIGTSSFFSAPEDAAQVKRIVGGIPYELALRLQKEDGATGFIHTPHDDHRGGYRFVGDHEAYKAVISEMLMEAGVTVYLQTMFCRVVMDGARIRAALVENKDGRQAIVAKQYIDASGDGDVANFAGVEQIENWQDYDQVCGGPTGLVFGMAGVNFDRLIKENNSAVRISYQKPATDGTPTLKLTFCHMRDPERYRALADLDINYFTGIQSIHPGEATYINNSKGIKIDASKAENLSIAEMKMRVKILRMAQALKACVPGFEESYLSWASTQLGIRASKVTVCDKTITTEEISNAARFEDEIGLYAFHDLAPKKPELFSKGPGFYGFPYRMLLAKGCENLLMAGRCVTEDIEAHMSTRNTVGCMLMGQAAGVAAAQCAKEGCSTRSLPYSRLRKALLDQGVILCV